jgi:hypothetical protein
MRLACLICGGVLDPNAGPPETPPWRCDECCWSWWVAELLPEAVKIFRRERYDFGDGGTPGYRAVRRAVEIEAELAQIRGVSVRPDQLDLIAPETLRGLLSRFRVLESMAAAMRERAVPSEVPAEWVS